MTKRELLRAILSNLVDIREDMIMIKGYVTKKTDDAMCNILNYAGRLAQWRKHQEYKKERYYVSQNNSRTTKD